MHENGLPEELTRSITATKNMVICYVRVFETLSTPFESCRGLISLTFITVLEGVILKAGIGTTFTKLVQLEEVDGFIYLGSLVSILKIVPTKLTLHKTLIRPVSLNGLELVTLLEEDLNARDVLKRKVLQTICGGKQTVDRVMRRLMKHELHAGLFRSSACMMDRLDWEGLTSY